MSGCRIIRRFLILTQLRKATTEEQRIYWTAEKEKLDREMKEGGNDE